MLFFVGGSFFEDDEYEYEYDYEYDDDDDDDADADDDDDDAYAWHSVLNAKRVCDLRIRLEIVIANVPANRSRFTTCLAVEKCCFSWSFRFENRRLISSRGGCPFFNAPVRKWGVFFFRIFQIDLFQDWRWKDGSMSPDFSPTPCCLPYLHSMLRSRLGIPLFVFLVARIFGLSIHGIHRLVVWS